MTREEARARAEELRQELLDLTGEVFFMPTADFCDFWLTTGIFSDIIMAGTPMTVAPNKFD